MSTSRISINRSFWPLYEIEDGKYKLSYRPSKKVPVADFMKPQRRFKHLFMPGNEHIVEKIQQHTDSEWEKHIELCGVKTAGKGIK